MTAISTTEQIIEWRFEKAITEHQWIDPQGDSTCTCGWECHPGEVRFAAYRTHFAWVLCRALLGNDK